MQHTTDPRKRMLVGEEVIVRGGVGRPLQGVVIRETHRMFAVRTQSGTKLVSKTGNTFVIDGKDVEGRTLVGRHEDRLKV